MGGDRSINIHAFADPQQIDPLYSSGKGYYLLPDGPAGQKSYGLLPKAMANKKVSPKGIGSGIRVVQFFLKSGRQELAAQTITRIEKAKRIRQAKVRAQNQNSAK
jgi:hypothetical protein